MQVRCRMLCMEIKRVGNMTEVTFEIVYTDSVENKEFFQPTPAGALKLAVVKPETAANWAVGKEYFIDIVEEL